MTCCSGLLDELRKQWTAEGSSLIREFFYGGVTSDTQFHRLPVGGVDAAARVSCTRA